MMSWYVGTNWGAWLIGCLMMLALLTLAVLVVVAAVRGSGEGRGRSPGRDILDERLARGEIDTEQYTRDLEALRRDGPRAGLS